jgi:hypothetical protein
MRYDNEAGKGDHRCVGDIETHYVFKSLNQLEAEFWRTLNDGGKEEQYGLDRGIIARPNDGLRLEGFDPVQIKYCVPGIRTVQIKYCVPGIRSPEFVSCPRNSCPRNSPKKMLVPSTPQDNGSLRYRAIKFCLQLVQNFAWLGWLSFSQRILHLIPFGKNHQRFGQAKSAIVH